MKPRISFVILLAFLLVQSAWGRGGGGCLEQGTPVLTPSGMIPIEKLRRGDVVLTVHRGRVQQATVQGSVEVQPQEYLVLKVAGRKLCVTPEHPMAVGKGEFREASRLRAGDSLFVWNGQSLRKTTLQSVEWKKADHPAYNLLVAPLGTFLADGVLVHNKGCFLPDTSIVRADGSSTAIRDIRPGDTLLAFDTDGKVVSAKVRDLVTHEVDEYVVVTTERTALRVTPEHPFYVGNGTFKTLDLLGIGDRIFAFDGRGLSAQEIVSLEVVRKRVRVYNLQTDSPHTFFAEGIAVHNKGGGCFPAGTPILTPRGPVSIDTLHPGDVVQGVDDNGRVVPTTVSASYVARSSLLLLETDRGKLRTTWEHPLKMEDGRFQAAGACRAGGRIMAMRDGHPVIATILNRVESPGRVAVFNLRVDAPHTFIADGFVVHNKGGGGGFGGGYHGGSHSSGGSDDPTVTFIAVGVIILIVIVNVASQKKREENLDFVYNPGAVARKANKTGKLLQFIASVDPGMEPEALRQTATSTFRKLQECWQERSYGPMKPLLMPDLFEDHCRELAGLTRHHEINIIEQLHVERVDLVNVRYPHKPDQREFTALFKARARDYYVDDRTRAFLRGDEQPATFQEFWTFQFQHGDWLLREIEQSRESDKLKEENFFEQFTDENLQRVYAESASPGGPAGPWLEQQTETKASRIARLLNFLVTTDGLWDRQLMIDRARQVFIKIKLAEEAGDPAGLPKDDLFADAAAHLEAELTSRRANGTTVEYRNLCVRKVELILVRNFTDNNRDDFTVRISAHAQRIVSRNHLLISRDEDVSPFLEYWTFGRLDNRWQLKEVLPPARGEAGITAENVDEESSPEQLQWYYQKSRAT